MQIILDTLTGREYPSPRKDGGPIVGLAPGLAVLTVITQPQPTPGEGYSVRLADPVDDVNAGTRTYGWIVEALPPAEPEPNYLAFWDATLLSSVYGALYLHSTVHLPTNSALTAFIAAFQDAKEDRANPPAIQACIYLILQATEGALTPEHLAELQTLMDTYNLSAIYTLSFPSQP